MRCTILTIGNLKSKDVKNLFESYRKRLNRIEQVVLKDSPGWEEKLLEYLETKDKIFLLSEDGKQFDSPEFAAWCREQGKDGEELVFVVAPAEGFSQKIKEKYQRISLSRLTFPHEIATLLLCEQL